MSFNKIILVGNLGRNPELRYTPQGTPVCTFSLATNEHRKDTQGGEPKDVTTWFRVTLWGKQAETASQYLQKGRPVYIEGRLRVEEYTGKEGGPRYSLEVNATDLQFIGGGREAGEFIGVKRAAAAAAPEGRPSPQSGEWVLKDGKPVRSAPPQKAGGGAGSIEDEDIPF